LPSKIVLFFLKTPSILQYSSLLNFSISLSLSTMSLKAGV